MRALALLLLLALLALPTVAALTVVDLERPRRLSDEALAFEVNESQAGFNRSIVFRNLPAGAFNVTIQDAEGKIHFQRNASRGVQPVLGLPAGTYSLIVRGNGTVQMLERSLDPPVGVETRLDGDVDAYRLRGGFMTGWTLLPEGNVEVDVFDLTRVEPLRIREGENASSDLGAVVVVTVYGEPDTPYAIRTVPYRAAPVPTITGTPASIPVGPLGLLALAAGVLLRRRT